LRYLDVDGQDLAAAGRDHLGFGHAPPFGGHDEQRGPFRTAEGAGETAAIHVDGLQHDAARRDARAPPDALPDAPPDALDSGFHRVRTHWIRGFMAFRLVQRIRIVMLMVPV